jgi:hypothetical protein
MPTKSSTEKLSRRSVRDCRLLLFVVAAGIGSLACAAANQSSQTGQSTTATPAQQSAQPMPQTTPAAAAKQTPSPTPPTLAEVQAAVTRACGGAVMVETGRPDAFVVGDFNGDGSQDLAVVVRPAKNALPTLNGDLANWIVEDAQHGALPDAMSAAQTKPSVPQPVKVQQNDLLLLVLHGYREAGWRHQLARQTFLLRNAVGENIRAQPLNATLKPANGRSAPALPGDVIRETLKGQDGFIYWAGARYLWHQ